MSTSTSERSAWSEIVAALSELSEIVTDETADTGQYSYKYASLATIMRTVRPVLGKHHLAISQPVATTTDGLLAVTTTLVHDSGVAHQSGALTVRMPDTPQRVGSAISYLRRYQLVALLGLATEDDDGKASSSPPDAPGTHRARTGGRSELSDGQRRRIMALFGELDLNGPDLRQARLAMTSEILGRHVETTNDVTPSEARVLIDELERAVTVERETAEPASYYS